MRALVTGATGFVGFHTAVALRNAGHEVRALVRSPEKAARVLGPLGLGREALAVGDMADKAAVREALRDCDAVVHAAAEVSVTRPGAATAFDRNAEGARRVLGGAAEAGVARILFVSSLQAVYDPQRGLPAPDLPPVEARTRYGRSKAESERFARKLQEGGAPLSIVYPSGVIGPDDPGLSESVRAYRGFLRAMILAGGTQFVDVRDLARLHRRLLERGGRARVVAAGHFFRWGELAGRIEAITGARIRRIRAPGAVLRALGSLGDRMARFTGRSLPLTREAMEVATRWEPVPDSPEVAELGVRWRDPDETLTDLYRSLVRAGRLPASAVPRIREEVAGVGD